MTEGHDYEQAATSLLELRYHIVRLDCRLMEQVIKREFFVSHYINRFRQLTDREVEVLQLLAQGLNNPMIAKKLLISRSTVETHRKHLKRKLNVKSHLILMKYALAFGLIRY